MQTIELKMFLLKAFTSKDIHAVKCVNNCSAKPLIACANFPSSGAEPFLVKFSSIYKIYIKHLKYINQTFVVILLLFRGG